MYSLAPRGLFLSFPENWVWRMGLASRLITDGKWTLAFSPTPLDGSIHAAGEAPTARPLSLSQRAGAPGPGPSAAPLSRHQTPSAHEMMGRVGPSLWEEPSNALSYLSLREAWEAGWVTWSHVLMEGSMMVVTRAGGVFALQRPLLGAFCPVNASGPHTHAQARGESDQHRGRRPLRSQCSPATLPPTPRNVTIQQCCGASSLPNMQNLRGFVPAPPFA